MWVINNFNILSEGDYILLLQNALNINLYNTVLIAFISLFTENSREVQNKNNQFKKV